MAAEPEGNDGGTHQELLDWVEELETTAGIQRGLAAVAAGEVVPLRQFEQEFRMKHGLQNRPR